MAFEVDDSKLTAVIRKIQKTADMETLTMRALRSMIEKELGLPAASLDKQKERITTLFDEISADPEKYSQHSEEEKLSEADEHCGSSSSESEADEEPAKARHKGKAHGAGAAAASKKSKAGASKSAKRDEAGVKRKRGAASDGKAKAKKAQDSGGGASQRLVLRLEDTVRGVGLKVPRKALSEAESEKEQVRILEDVLGKAGLPRRALSKKEQLDVKTKRELERDVAAIQHENVVESRRRQTKAVNYKKLLKGPKIVEGSSGEEEASSSADDSNSDTPKPVDKPPAAKKDDTSDGSTSGDSDPEDKGDGSADDDEVADEQEEEEWNPEDDDEDD